MKTEPDTNTVPLSGHYKKHMDKTYLGSHDLSDDDGGYKSVTVEISAIHKRQIFNPGSKKDETKLIAALKGKEKMIILNATNLAAIEGIAGTPMSHKWVGHKVRLVVHKVPLGKAMVDAIRIEKPINQKGVE